MDPHRSGLGRRAAGVHAGSLRNRADDVCAVAEAEEVYVQRASLPPQVDGLDWHSSDPKFVRYAGNKTEELINFLKVSGDKEKDPPWKLVQFAVWSIVEDIEYARVRPEGADNHLRFRGNEQFATAGQIDQVMTMIEESNLDRSDFRLWQELLAELDKYVVEYENDYTSDPDRAFMSFRQICNYYPLDVAEDIMLSAFDRHEGQAGIKFRLRVVEVLGEHGTTKEIAALKRRSDFETDDKVLAKITTIVERLEKTLKAAPARLTRQSSTPHQLGVHVYHALN